MHVLRVMDKQLDMKKLLLLLLFSVWTFAQQNPCTLTIGGVDYVSLDLPCADFESLELTEVSDGVFTDSNSDHVLQHTIVDGVATTALSSSTFNVLESAGLQSFISTLLTGGSAEITIGNQNEGSTVTGKRASSSTSRSTPIRFSHVYRNNHSLSITRSSNNQIYSDAYRAGDITSLTRGHSRIRLSYGRWIARSTQINAPTTGVTNYRVYTAVSEETIVNPSGGNFQLEIQSQQGLFLLSESLASAVTVSGVPLTVSNGYYYGYAFPGTHPVSITTPQGVRTFDVTVLAGVQYNLANSFSVALTESTGNGWYNVSFSDNDIADYGMYIRNRSMDSLYRGHHSRFFLTKNYGNSYPARHGGYITHNSIRYESVGNGIYLRFLNYDLNSGLATFERLDHFDDNSITTVTIPRSTDRPSNDIYERRLATQESISLEDRVNNAEIDISTIYATRDVNSPSSSSINGVVLPDAIDTNRRSIDLFDLSSNGSCYTERSNDFSLTRSSWSRLEYRGISDVNHELNIYLDGTYLSPTYRLTWIINGVRRQIDRNSQGVVTYEHIYESSAYRTNATYTPSTSLTICE